jgi:hypothetical protein
MRQLKIVWITLTLSLLTACGKPTIPSITYQKPIDFNVNKCAVLQWEYGKQHDAAIPCSQSGSLVGDVINSIDRANNPSRYTVAYGKAEQAVFMTSFRDVLKQNQVFKEVQLASEVERTPTKDILINVFFKTSRISNVDKGYRITLTVVMAITTDRTPSFTRTYLVQSEPQGFFGDHTNLDVSTRLLEKLIAGIEEWHNLNRKGSK